MKTDLGHQADGVPQEGKGSRGSWTAERSLSSVGTSSVPAGELALRSPTVYPPELIAPAATAVLIESLAGGKLDPVLAATFRMRRAGFAEIVDGRLC